MSHQPKISIDPQLKEFIDEHCLIVDKQIKLSTGAMAGWYFDCKKATLNGEQLIKISDGIIDIVENYLKDAKIDTIAGLTIGADPLISGVVVRAAQRGSNLINGSIVRKEPKSHGTRNHIENDMESGTHVVVVDDVITTGSSTNKACEKLLEAGYIIKGIVALIDREAGGAKTLSDQYNCPVHSLFKKSDFPRIGEIENNT